MNNVKLNAVIYKNIGVVLLFSLICSLLAAGFLFFLAPIEYETGTSLFISNIRVENSGESPYWDMASGRSLAENYAEIIKSEMFTEIIIKRLGLIGITPAELSSHIATDVLGNSNVLEIKVRYKDKALAKTIAGFFPKLLNEKPLEIAGRKQVTLLNGPHCEAEPLIIDKLIILLISFLSGMILAICFLFISQRRKRIIRDHEDIESCLGLKVAGTIPDYRI